MSLNDPQGLPQAGIGPKTWQLVISDMHERDEMGARKYGVRHQHDNGRDHLVDLYQELLDGAVYIRAEIERRRNAGPVDAADARDALADECAMLRRSVAEAQADAARLRAALVKNATFAKTIGTGGYTDAALATRAGDEALREFGLRCINMWDFGETDPADSSCHEQRVATVDAVLRGER